MIASCISSGHCTFVCARMFLYHDIAHKILYAIQNAQPVSLCLCPHDSLPRHKIQNICTIQNPQPSRRRSYIESAVAHPGHIVRTHQRCKFWQLLIGALRCPIGSQKWHASHATFRMIQTAKFYVQKHQRGQKTHRHRTNPGVSPAMQDWFF